MGNWVSEVLVQTVCCAVPLTSLTKPVVSASFLAGHGRGKCALWTSVKPLTSFLFWGHRSSDGAFLAVSSTDGYCTFVTFEKGELGIPLKEKPVLSIRTPDTAKKAKNQAHQGSSPGSRSVKGTPSNRIQDPSSPCTTPSPTTQSPAQSAIKDSPSAIPAGGSSLPRPSEEKTLQPAGQNMKAPQPRRVTLNTLQTWGKTAPR